MGYTELELKVPTDFSNSDLKKVISQKIDTSEHSFSILRKSLDARNKRDIHWLLRIGVTSPAIKGEAPEIKKLEFPSSDHGKEKKVIITGCGPAGIFCGLILQRSGYSVVVIEKGGRVQKRTVDIESFENSGLLIKNSGYCFGEGGAGTFSDGKLTSRTKTITLEKNFIFEELIKAGAPEEIAYMTHPHLGSDNLKKIIPAIISDFRSRGGTVLFETEVTEIHRSGDKITALEITGKQNGKLEGDGLQKRVSELDAKLDHAIQKHPDLPSPPEWYLREKEYLGDKFFATAGKSKYETELTEEQKERQQRYLNYLEKIKETGEAVSDEQLAETKEQILGD